MTIHECPFQKKFPSQLNKDAVFFMQLAYNQAIEAWRKDEVPIGAIIVHRDTIIAAAHNLVETTKDPTAHAEMLAITQAAHVIGDWRLNDCTLYVTKEPCPMCSGAVMMSRLQRIVYAVPDPKMGFLGGAYSTHLSPGLNHRTEVISGILEDDCKTILQSFFSLKRKDST